MGVSSCSIIITINPKPPMIAPEESYSRIKRLGGGAFGEAFLIISLKTKIQYVEKRIILKNPNINQIQIISKIKIQIHSLLIT